MKREPTARKVSHTLVDLELVKAIISNDGWWKQRPNSFSSCTDVAKYCFARSLVCALRSATCEM